MFWPVVIFMALSLAIGLYTYTQVQGSSKRYTVCGKSMPFIVVGTALAAQAIDGNATLGNTSLTYSLGFWTGAAIPIGLAVSLVIVGRFLAGPLNKMDLLTLPEFFHRRYGRTAELLASVLTIICFIVVVAGNLSAVAWILSVVSGFSYGQCLLAGTAVILLYTVAGGLYAAIWTDFFQIHVAIVGFLCAAGYVLWTRGWDPISAALPPQTLSLSQMTTIAGGGLVNWASIVSLAFGNAMALDFMERVFSAKLPETAKKACYYAAGWTIVVGLCASLLGLAAISTIGKIDDPRMVLPAFARGHLPYWIGVLVFVGVLGASMSTANGAMLVISVVMARNVWQRWSSRRVTDSWMLFLSRALALPTAIAAAWIAYVRPEPGILLVVAFDIVFAGCVIPLFLGVYWARATQAGALASILTGTIARGICYFVVPAEWAGLDTLLPPVLSAVAFVAGSLSTAPSTTENTEELACDTP
ncbi:MAG: sodium:solute symporter family transporter [Bryobacteraceae bacterium]